MKITVKCKECGGELATVYRYRKETTIKVKPECECRKETARPSLTGPTSGSGAPGG